MRRIRFGTPIITDAERETARQVLKSRSLTNGGRVQGFEEDFVRTIGGGLAVAVSSCTAALHLAMMAIGIGRGDEVIVPALTFVATAHAVELTGAQAVFADSWHETGGVDPADVEHRITPQTKAIAVVHYLGRPCYMRSIVDVARRHNLPIVEDCAHSLGAWHRDAHTGLIGDVGCFSFHPAKHITTCEGGMLLSRNPELAEKARLMRQFGKTDPYDVISLGLNYRMTEVQGELGRSQLQTLNDRLAKRERNYRLLKECLLEFEILDTGSDPLGAYTSSHYALTILMPKNTDRDTVIEKLRNDWMIEASIYFPGPVHLLSYYRKKYGYKPGDLPVAENISSRALTLPVGPHLGEEHVHQMAKAVKLIVRGQ